MDVRLDGRNALITGASLGLGKAMAARFAEAGAGIAMLARRAEVLEEARAEIAAAHDVEIRTYVCDVGDADEVARAFARVGADFGQVDILVNNAGTSRTGRFLEIDDETWQADLDLKLFAAIRFARLALPDMIARRWGRILNVLNTAAKAPSGGSAPTSVSRAAGMALTKVLANEGAPHNVLVNALCTGSFVSDQRHRLHRQTRPDLSFEDYLAETGKSVPLGRVGEAGEFANLACFLASDAASYLTGTAINIDGGRSPVV